MINFDTYKFRAHSIGYIMGGISKPLTEEQERTYNSLLAKHQSNNKNLTYSQMRKYSNLMAKHKNPEKQLTDKQRIELTDLMLKYELTGKNLTLNQIDTFGDLIRKKKGKPYLDNKAKSFLEKIFWQVVTGRTNDITSKSIEKGLMCEEKSFTLYSSVTNTLLLKNKERKENDYFTGECDNAQKGIIRDIKTSWEYLTFPLTEDKVTSSLYPWQQDVYMDLWDLKKAEIIYCLVDTPFKLIDDHLRSIDRDLDIFTIDGDVRKTSIPVVVETVTRHLFTNKALEAFCHQSPVIELEWFEGVFKEIPEEMRVKVFKQDYSQDRNDQLKEMVELAREYLNGLLETLGQTVLEYSELKKTG